MRGDIQKKIDDKVLQIVQNNTCISTNSLLRNLSPQGKGRKAGIRFQAILMEGHILSTLMTNLVTGPKKVYHLSPFQTIIICRSIRMQ